MEIPDSCNYIEIVLRNINSEIITDNHNTLKWIDMNVSEDAFAQCLDRIRKHRFKNFQKSFKTYIKADHYLENMEHEDIKVYTRQIVKLDASNKAYVKVYMQKEKKPFHAFPSTSKIHSVYYTNRLTFRINNRLFLNFDVLYYPEDQQVVRKVFINYNHDSHVDTEHIQMSLEPILKCLVE